MSDNSVIWDRQPHTAAKHAILNSYLGAWFPKLAWSGRLVFIDGFAGPGEYKNGEPGSPLIAISAALDHKANLSDCELVYIFVERDKATFEHLEGLLKGLDKPGSVKTHVLNAEFADSLADILDDMDSQGKNLAPSLIMADPFGFAGLPFELVARAAKQPRSEFIISFMYESVVRWRNHPDLKATFDRLFGCSDWHDADALTSERRKDFLIGLYEKQLKSVGLQYVRSFEMVDRGNRTEYFLVYATHSIDGLKAMKAAMWNADPSGRFQFSDYATTGPQLLLIQPQPDYDQLRRLLVNRFAGAPATVEDIEHFVLVDTPFRESHYKKQILAKMEQEGNLVIVDSPRKKARTYPPGTIILLR